MNIRKEDRQWAEEVSAALRSKLYAVAERNRYKIPFTAGPDGRYDDMGSKNICFWTNGFWGGIMWQLYHATGEGLYRETAEAVEEKLDRNLMDYQGMDHDSGFKWLLTAVAHFRVDGNRKSCNRAMLAAGNLAGRFNPAGNYIRAWNDDGDGSYAGLAIIDCMMNLPLLYWAYEQTHDPRFYHIAVAHADTALKYFIREDGSVKHIVEFDSVTGAYVRSHGGQGYAHGSAWARGQSWAVYGFALSFQHTKREAYLTCAQNAADYFMENIREGGIVPVDFVQPVDCALEDTSAAAIAACGMLEIAGLLPEEKAIVYQDAAIQLLKMLAEKRCNFTVGCDNIVERCTGAFHDKRHEFPLIYADYYFLEAIWKLTGQELFMW